MIPAPRARVRRVIASMLAHPADALVVGSVVLHDTQCETVRRARVSLDRFGGVLLADDVGAGKTFVALAIAATYANPLVIAPAALRQMWEVSARKTSVRITFQSVESLPGTHARFEPHDIVLIDEAHHLRNPATKRYAAARRIAGDARLVLLSATPIHNKAGDLDAQLALFLGADARDLDQETRALAVIRAVDTLHGPRVEVHPPFIVPDSDELLENIQALPAPVSPCDGGNAPALVRIGFLRAWCSSREAAATMARRAEHRAAALLDAVRAGRQLTKRDLRSWIGAGEDQLGFTELLSDAVDGPVEEASAAAYVHALAALRRTLSTLHWVDDERARQMCAIMEAHGDTPILACSQFTATVDAMWNRLRMLPGVAMLTSKGARIASGSISRDAALARFAPRAMGARVRHARERIRLLIATDLVSEGLNLHDAGAVVHLDVPWTAARLAQRVGRIARTGSLYLSVHSYALAPPKAAAALLALEKRITAKRRIAARLVGGAQRDNRLMGGHRSTDAAPELHAQALRLLREWAGGVAETSARLACGVTAPRPGWLALIHDGDRGRLVARIGRGAPTTDPATILRGVRWLVSANEHWLPAAWEDVCTEVDQWVERQRGRQLSGALRANAARVQGRTLAATLTALSNSLPHERVHVATSAASLHLDDPRFAPRETSVRALVVFCMGDETD